MLGDSHEAETFAPLEADPLGKKPNEEGAKLDAGKNRLGLVLLSFSRSLQEVGKVGTYGANKYSDMAPINTRMEDGSPCRMGNNDIRTQCFAI